MKNNSSEMKKLDKLVSREGARGVAVLTSEELDELFVELTDTSEELGELLMKLTDIVQDLEKMAGGRING